MGEWKTKPFQLSFNGLLKGDFRGSQVTSDSGLILDKGVGREARPGDSDRRASDQLATGLDQIQL